MENEDPEPDKESQKFHDHLDFAASMLKIVSTFSFMTSRSICCYSPSAIYNETKTETLRCAECMLLFSKVLVQKPFVVYLRYM